MNTILATGLLLSLFASNDVQNGAIRWHDIDQDGRKDALVVSEHGGLRLLLSAADGSFEDATSRWGLDALAGVRGVALSERRELLVLSVADGPRLLRVEEASFVDITAGSGLEGLALLTDARFFDADEDGIEDIEAHGPTGAVTLLRGLGESSYRAHELVGPRPLVVLAPLGGVSAANEGEPDASGAPAETPSTEGAVRGSVGSRRPALAAPNPPRSTHGTVGAIPLRATPVTSPFADGLRDVSSTGIIRADSSPRPGHLLPLGLDFFVDAGGRVGLGTEIPRASVHVLDELQPSMRLASTSSSSYTSKIELATEGDYVKGITLNASPSGLGVMARSADRLGEIGDHGPHLFVAKKEDTRVGIGTGSPVAPLHVAGWARIEPDAGESGLDIALAGETQTIEFLADEGANPGSAIRMYDRDKARTIEIKSFYQTGAALFMSNGSGAETVRLTSGQTGESEFELMKSNGNTGVKIQGSYGGLGRVTTEVLNVTGGSDLAEGFDTTDGSAEPGSVLAIDPHGSGELRLAREPYDRRVAGVVSGAGGIRAGMHMGQAGVLDGDTLVALTGRVYVRCTDENGRIRPGDLLTTSSTPGAAMRATDELRSNGAVLGKAMTPLDGASGLVLVLVNLQ